MKQDPEILAKREKKAEKRMKSVREAEERLRKFREAQKKKLPPIRPWREANGDQVDIRKTTQGRTSAYYRDDSNSKKKTDPRSVSNSRDGKERDRGKSKKDKKSRNKKSKKSKRAKSSKSGNSKSRR